MKNKLLVVSILLSLSFYGTRASERFKQTTDSIIKVTGRISNIENDFSIEAKIFYEKLPYYDDMGKASTIIGTGIYEMYMILGNKYMVEIKGYGHETLKKEIVVVDQGNGQMTQDFLMQPSFSKKKISIENLNFANSLSIISESSYPGLDAFAQWLKDRPTAIVQLEGHTDFQGNAEANMKLSRDRVEEVKKYLVDKGIKKLRIVTKAYGGTQPVTTDRSPKSRAQNRRVEVVLLQQ